MKLPAQGSCQCGNVTYRVVEQPLITVACNCRDCQKLSGGAFSLSMVMRRSGLELLSGDLASWERPTEQGGVARCWFCPTCSNRIYHDNPAAPEVIRLKPGTLDDTSVIEPAARLWTCRQQPWLEHFSDVHGEETQPDLAAALAALAAGKSPF